MHTDPPQHAPSLLSHGAHFVPHCILHADCCWLAGTGLGETGEFVSGLELQEEEEKKIRQIFVVVAGLYIRMVRMWLKIVG